MLAAVPHLGDPKLLCPVSSRCAADSPRGPAAGPSLLFSFTERSLHPHWRSSGSHLEGLSGSEGSKPWELLSPQCRHCHNPDILVRPVGSVWTVCPPPH